MLKRGDTDPWLGNLTVARFPSSFASGDGLTRSRLMGIGGHVVLARTRSSALTLHLSVEPRIEGRIGSDFFSSRPALNLETTRLTALAADHPRPVGQRFTYVPASKNGELARGRRNSPRHQVPK